MRRAGASDLARVGELWDEITDEHTALDPVWATRSDPVARDGLLRRLLADPDTALWVHESQAGRLDGLCIVRLRRAPALLVEPSRAEIVDLGVSAEQRRRGVGRALVGAALGWTRERGARRVEVRVAARNRAGQSFWRALGFGDFVDVLDLRL